MDQDGGDAPGFSVSHEVTGSHVEVVATGEVDMATAAALAGAAAPDGAESATLDLRAVTFFDSAAIQALIRLAERYPGTLQVLPSAQVLRVLDISGLSGQSWLRRPGPD